MSEGKNNTTEEMVETGIKKARLGWLKGWHIILFTVGLLLILYFVLVIYYAGHFYRGTVINFVNCSNMTVAEAEEALHYEAENFVLTIEERESKTETLKGTDFDLQYKLEGSIEDTKEEQNPFLWPVSLFRDSNYELEAAVKYDEAKLNAQIQKLDCMQKENVQPPISATISEYTEGTGYTIVPEQLGTEVMPKEMNTALLEAIKSLQPELSLESAGCYKPVKVKQDDKTLNQALEKMNRYVSAEITHKFGKDTEVLTGAKISKWLRLTKENKVFLSEKKVAEYVRKLARKYDTFGRVRNLKTSYRTTVKITSGDYGWWMNQTKETKNIIKLIKRGKKKTKEASYYQKAAQYGKKDYGNTYVEINLSTQHLYYYKNGKLVVESDFVSGNQVRGDATPAGIYPLMYRQSPAVLRGDNYNTPVTYWMPFNNNIGMHDATWRNRFGGTIYKTGGSHGCINLPYSAAKKIYNNIEPGTAVICYHYSPPSAKKKSETTKKKNATTKKKN